jgi:hypothetical protein
MQDEQVKQLYDYTKFHIGLYTALITGVTTVLGFARTQTVRVGLGIVPYLGLTLFFLVIAGMAGGVIGSTISLDSDVAVKDEKIGPLNGQWFKITTWAHIEHWAFWCGILSTIVGVCAGYLTNP